MGIFKSNKSELAAGGDIPVSQVMAMKQQGYTNNQIISSLQRDGYTSSQIFDAISQSETPTAQPTADVQQLGAQLPPIQQGPMQMQQSSGMPQATPEELVEAIIDEKWNDLVKDINKVIEWKQKADVKLASMEQQMTDLQLQFDKLHQAILGKINDYDKHILDVGTQLQAMEKVFSKVLPTFVDNVNELTRVTEKIKSGKNVKKGKDEDE